MNHHLTGMRVAALVEHGFEQSELLEPRKALEDAGARVDVVSPVEGAVKGWHHGTWGEEVKVDQPLADAHPGGLRRAAAAWRRVQSRSAADERARGAIRQGFTMTIVRWRRSATDPGRSSRPMRCATGA